MKTSLKLGLITLILFGAGGWILIEYVQQKSVVQVLNTGKSFPVQIIAGLVAGLGASAIAIWIISLKFFDAERDFYHGLIGRWKLNFSEMIFRSWCAGIGEELFFRGGVQPLLGNWWTSILFVLLHGYLNPRNWRISIYGAVMVGIIYGFGSLFEHIGIVSAMVAHAVLDIALFGYMARLDRKD